MATDNYKCSLSAESIKIAKEELNEDPKERLGAVETFRQWVLQQPHLKCPTDTMYLLRFLRRAHFSQLEARNVMEKYLRNKTLCPKWLSNIDPREKRLLAALKTGQLLPLPGYNDLGRKVMLARWQIANKNSKFRNGFLNYLFNDTKPLYIAKINTVCKDYDKNDVLKTYFTFFNYLLNDEELQVNGFEYFLDLTGITIAHTSYFSLEEHAAVTKIIEGGLPARVKMFHMYNGGSVFDTFLSLFKPLMPKKMAERLRLHGSNLESVYKHIPMRILPGEYLPDDYKGPSAGPVDKLLEAVLKQFEDEKIRQDLLEESKPEYGVDKSKRPTDIPEESFRRLNVD